MRAHWRTTRRRTTLCWPEALVINSAGSFTDGLNGGTPLGSATAFIMNGATMNWGANGTDLTSAAGNVILNGGTLTESGAGPSEVTTQNNNVVVLSNTTFDAPLQGTAAKTAFFNVAAGVTFTQSGLLFGNNTGNVVKIGPGILSLQGATADAGTGDMVVNEGVLQLNKTAAPSQASPLVIGDFNSIGTVTAVALVSGGLGYTANLTNQAFTFSGGLASGGTAATGTYSTNANGTVTSISITSAGSGYISAPTIPFLGNPRPTQLR